MGLLHLPRATSRWAGANMNIAKARAAREEGFPSPNGRVSPWKAPASSCTPNKAWGTPCSAFGMFPWWRRGEGKSSWGSRKGCIACWQEPRGRGKSSARARLPRSSSWHCPLLSLPLAFATDLSTIPAGIPYVNPDPAHVEAWGQRLRGNSLRIGLAWGGNPNYPHELWRSIPLEQLAPLTNLEGTTFYSLQLGAPARQVKQLGPRVRLIDLQDEQKDFADTAAIVANLDLVISIDTSVAHLAGAMGKPVWILLNNSPDWRWLLEREDSPWYPTARLFRQSTFGNWQDVVARVERELRELVAKTAVSAERRRSPCVPPRKSLLSLISFAFCKPRRDGIPLAPGG